MNQTQLSAIINKDCECSQQFLFEFISYWQFVLAIDNIDNLILMQDNQVISQEERKRLDRQRFIGWQTQKKLLNSRVLITPANGPNTELAKNLILAGVNVTIYDNAVANEDDFESNFLIAQSDIGRSRSLAVFQRLKQMNPTGKNECFEQDLLTRVQSLTGEDLKRYSMIATSTANLQLAAKWDLLARSINVPYYNLVCCGLHAFVFISLGQSYTYSEINKKDNLATKIWNIKSLELPQALLHTKADKNREFIAAIAMMDRAQRQGIQFNPLEPNSEQYQKIVKIGQQLLGEKLVQKHGGFIREFARTYGLDYCPVYSVIGSIISQEVIKVVENQTQPGINWLVFNSEQGYSNIVKLSIQKERITVSAIPKPQE